MTITLTKPSLGRRANREKPARTKKPTAPQVPALPSANLLGPEVLEVVTLRRLRRGFVLAGAATVAAVVAGWGLQTGMISSATADLEREQARAESLTAQVSALGPVRSFYGQIEANRATIQTTMANEVLFSGLVADLNRATPNGVDLGNVSMAATTSTAATPTATAASCPSPDPFTTTATVGCVTVSGEARTRSLLGSWISGVEKTDVFTQVFVNSTSVDTEGTVTFAATVGLADSAYTRRYLDSTFMQGDSQ